MSTDSTKPKRTAPSRRTNGKIAQRPARIKPAPEPADPLAHLLESAAAALNMPAEHAAAELARRFLGVDITVPGGPKPEPAIADEAAVPWNASTCRCAETGRPFHAHNCPVDPDGPIDYSPEQWDAAADTAHDDARETAVAEAEAEPPLELSPDELGQQVLALHARLDQLATEAEGIVAERRAIDDRGIAAYTHAVEINRALAALTYPQRVADLLHAAGIRLPSPAADS